MALPTIIFNASTGSDTAASGAGPAGAVSGSAAAHTGGSASTTITLTNTPDLSGVATDGSAVLWLKTAAGRQFSKIVGVDDGADTVTVEDSFTIEAASAVDYAIGGKRATWDEAASRAIFLDVKAGWTIETETDQSLTSALPSPSAVHGDGTAGGIVVKGNGSTITQTANASIFQLYGCNYWIFDGFDLTCSNATKTLARGFNVYSSNLVIRRCTMRGMANGFYRNGSYPTVRFEDCLFLDLSGAAISGELSPALYGCVIARCGGTAALDFISRLELIDSIIANCSGKGVRMASSLGPIWTVKNSVIYNNGGDGIDLTYAALSGWSLSVTNSVIAKNGGYGINLAAGENQNQFNIDYNCYGHADSSTANTSGAVNNCPAGANSLYVDPQFTDAANLDFSIGTNLKAKGWPLPTTYLGNGGSLTRSYVDIGAAQRQEAAGGGSRAVIIGG